MKKSQRREQMSLMERAKHGFDVQNFLFFSIVTSWLALLQGFECLRARHLGIRYVLLF